MTQRKKELQRAIEAQQDMGWEDLTEEDQYLAEVNLRSETYFGQKTRILVSCDSGGTGGK